MAKDNQREHARGQRDGAKASNYERILHDVIGSAFASDKYNTGFENGSRHRSVRSSSRPSTYNTPAIPSCTSATSYDDDDDWCMPSPAPANPAEGSREESESLGLFDILGIVFKASLNGGSYSDSYSYLDKDGTLRIVTTSFSIRESKDKR